MDTQYEFKQEADRIVYVRAVEVADLPAYKAFHTDVMGTLPQVNAITTFVVMGSPKDARA